MNYIDAFTIDEIRNPARARLDGASSERLEIGGAIVLDEVADRAPGEIRAAQATHLDATLRERLHEGIEMGFESAPQVLFVNEENSPRARGRWPQIGIGHGWRSLVNPQW